MKLVREFRRQLRTRRALVFENILDLDHVCSLHRRWFRNLRVIEWRSDYVEYRLVGLFYGLRQDLLVRGAPIDADRYWYEFLGPLARIRVEGRMEGEDGELTLTEAITFQFPAYLAPAFLLLGPLFRRQKEDILLADSRLLEREYALERGGFRRLPDGLAPLVVVYGGGGFFGRLVVEELLRDTDARVVIASRRPRRPFPVPEARLLLRISDLEDHASILRTIEGARVVINCTGPFQGQGPGLLRACIEKRVHYVDVADDREFVLRCRALAGPVEEAGIAAFIGCSVVPGVACILTHFLRSEVPAIEETRISISPGTRHPRGPGSFLSLLSTIGREFEVPAREGTKRVAGWTEPERVVFPAPMGARRVYRVVDVPDYVLQPQYFGTKQVTFKIGSELDLLNRALGGFRRAAALFRLRDLGPLVPLFRLLVAIASPFGTSQGGVMVEVRGSKGARPATAALSVFAEKRGEIIPAFLPSLACRMALDGEVRLKGIVPLDRWLSRERFVSEAARRNIQVAVRRGGSEEWAPFG